MDSLQRLICQVDSRYIQSLHVLFSVAERSLIMAYHFESIRIASDGPSYNNPALVDQRKLNICGLSPETTTEFLLHFFRKYGEIEEGSIAFEKYSNRSRGFGFVTYKTMEAAQKAILDPEKLLCLVLDSFGMGDKQKLANHSSNPNCYTKVISGEEIFYDYQISAGCISQNIQDFPVLPGRGLVIITCQSLGPCLWTSPYNFQDVAS